MTWLHIAGETVEGIVCRLDLGFYHSEASKIKSLVRAAMTQRTLWNSHTIVALLLIAKGLAGAQESEKIASVLFRPLRRRTSGNLQWH
jgi:hypothetical protein